MKKLAKFLPLLGLAIIALLIVVFVVPVGTGMLVSVLGIEISGYDVIFGNEAINALKASSATIAAFTLLVIGAVFQVVATILCVPNPKGSKKFSGFLFVVAGLAEICTSAIYLAATSVTDIPYSLTLGWSLIVAGIVALVAALGSIVVGVIAYRK